MSLKSYGEMSVLGEDVVKIAFRKFVIHIYITKPHKIGWRDESVLPEQKINKVKFHVIAHCVGYYVILYYINNMLLFYEGKSE